MCGDGTICRLRDTDVVTVGPVGRCRRPSGITSDAQFSDPMNLDTCVYDRTGWEDIQHRHAIISQAFDSGSHALP